MEMISLPSAGVAITILQVQNEQNSKGPSAGVAITILQVQNEQNSKGPFTASKFASAINSFDFYRCSMLIAS